MFCPSVLHCLFPHTHSYHHNSVKLCLRTFSVLDFLTCSIKFNLARTALHPFSYNFFKNFQIWFRFGFYLLSIIAYFYLFIYLFICLFIYLFVYSYIYWFIYLFIYLLIHTFWYFKNESWIIALAKLTKDRINGKNQYKGCSIFFIKTIKTFKTFKIYENCVIKLHIWLPHPIAQCKTKTQ